MDDLPPVGDLGILLVIEWATAAHDRQDQEVVLLRWRGGIPFECMSIPRIFSSWLTVLQSGNQVEQEDHNRETNREGSDRGEQVQLVPAQVSRIGIDTARHTEQPQV